MFSRSFIERSLLIVIGAYITYFLTLKLLDYTMLQESGQENIQIPPDLNLTNHEKIIYSMVVDKKDINVKFEDVKGSLLWPDLISAPLQQDLPGTPALYFVRIFKMASAHLIL